MGKKIAIITYFNAFSYGGDLQCFSLQHKLRKLGYNAEVLNVKRPVSKEYVHTTDDSLRFQPLYKLDEKHDRISLIRARIAKIISRITALVFRKRHKYRTEQFNSFHENHISFSNKTYSNFSELYGSQELNKYTHFITGSDQVWNFQYPYSLEPYFLTFVNKGIKISYAASIGHSEVPEELKSVYKNFLADFDFISLREKRGVELIKNITDRDDIIHVLDPSLLLSRDEWIQDLQLDKVITPLKNEKYVLVYLLSRSKFSLNLASKIAKLLSCKIVLVNSNLHASYFVKNGKFVLGEGPQEFVRLFSNAEFVITNSFHGTAFSINFNIPFISTTRKNKRVNSRFISLLALCSLSERLIYEGDRIEIKDFLPIDFSHANKAIEDERVKAIAFLHNALKG